MRRRHAWLAVGLLLVGLAHVLAARAEPSDAPSHRSTPLSRVLRDVEWIRFQRARLRGEVAQALRHAERALELDPGHTEGWVLLASDLAVYRGSPLRELEPERRRLWLDAGLEVARRGRATARDPDRLELWEGTLLIDRARLDPDLDPGGARALLRRALEALGPLAERLEDGAPHAAEARLMADFVREELASPD